jgi:hypothetical protein
MRIDADIAVALATRMTYIEMLGLNGYVNPSSLKDNSGVRALQENQWRDLDLYEIMRFAELGKNKILLLQMLKRSSLIRILFLLEKDKLLNGLRFFSKEKLLSITTSLPKALQLKMLLHLMPMDQLIQRLPAREIFNILRSKRLTERELVKGFSNLDPKYLQQVLMKITGQPTAHMSQAEMLDSLGKLKKYQILNGMVSLPFKALFLMVSSLAKNDPEILQQISGQFLYKMFDQMSKPTLIEGYRVLPDEMIIRVLALLPDKFLPLIAAQIDDTVLEAYLLSEEPELLMQMVGGGIPAADLVAA